MERYIETPRLILKPLSMQDAPDALEWGSDPMVNRYMSYNVYQTVQQAERWIASISDDAYVFGFF